MSILVVYVAVGFGMKEQKKMVMNGHDNKKIKFSKENANFGGVQMHLDRCSPMFCENYVYKFSLQFNGIDEIAGGFTSKLKIRKS